MPTGGASHRSLHALKTNKKNRYEDLTNHMIASCFAKKQGVLELDQSHDRFLFCDKAGCFGVLANHMVASWTGPSGARRGTL